MISDFDPRRDPDDFDMGRPTVNSSWLAVIVLVIGVALAVWYVLLTGYDAPKPFAAGSEHRTRAAEQAVTR